MSLPVVDYVGIINAPHMSAMRSILTIGLFRDDASKPLDYFSLSFLRIYQDQGTQRKTSGLSSDYSMKASVWEECCFFFFRRSLQTKQRTFGALMIGSVIGLFRTGNRHRNPTLKSCTWTTISECIKLDKAMSSFRSRKKMTLFGRNGRCVMSHNSGRLPSITHKN